MLARTERNIKQIHVAVRNGCLDDLINVTISGTGLAIDNLLDHSELQKLHYSQVRHIFARSKIWLFAVKVFNCPLL